MKKRRTIKRKKRNNTQDVLTQQEEEEQTEPWSRHGSSMEVDSGLRNELENLFDGKANSRAHKMMTQYFDNQGSTKGLASYCTFNSFMNGVRNIPLRVQNRDKFREYIAKSSCSVPNIPVPADLKSYDSDGDDSDGSKHDNSDYYGAYHEVCTEWRGEEEKWLASQNGRQEDD